MSNFDNGQRPGLDTPTHEKAPVPSTVTEALPEQRQQSNFTATAQEAGNPEKTFVTLRAKFARRGHRLERTFHGESKVPTYYTERWGLVRWLPTLHDAAMFLTQIGERL
jgi:hypothetical protein